jgi:imidazolonepropionase-like amidohydrolase
MPVFPRSAVTASTCAGLLAALTATPALLAQRAERSVPSAYAITGARIVPVSGTPIANGTIVIRDGLIAAVGARVSVPADARVIDGAGLTIYPGFIDAYGSLGLGGGGGGGGGGRGGGRGAGGPAATEGRASNSPYPPGLQPEIVAVDLLRADDDAFVNAHAGGFTAALTAPADGIFQGQSAFINLSGEIARMVVRTPIAQHIGFTPLRTGGYPNSLMGVFASLRQMLLDAQNYRDALAAYEANPRGMRRPEYDAALAALQPVITRQQPVVMYAMTQREIERALDLAKEFNVRAIIAGGREAPLVAERLKAEGVPVLLSANFPRPPAAAPSSDADPEPLRVLRERADAPKAPGRLQQSGVKFALISGGASGADHLANVRKAIDNGLPADLALRALTIAPAEILGVSDRLGTIEVGKIANLTLATGDAFSASGRITQLFIDGNPVIVRPATNAASASASGSWTATVSIDGEVHAITLALRQEGTRLTGSMQGSLGTNEIADGSIGADGEFSFHVSITVKEGTEQAQFQGRFELDTIRGRVTIVGHEPGTFAGTRPAGGGGRGGRGGPPGGVR